MKLKDLESIDIEAVAVAVEKDAGEEIPTIRQALSDAKVGKIGVIHTPDQIAIQQARKRLGVSQAAFAKMIHTPIATLRDWEQGRYAPSGAAVMLSRIVADHPEMVHEYS